MISRPKTMPKGLKKFYVGSNNVTSDWTKDTLAEAVAHAQSIIDKGDAEETFVVEIKRVVRKRVLPATVEDFKPAKAAKK